jgi:SAM-dependent MidA family methyltransferase
MASSTPASLPPLPPSPAFVAAFRRAAGDAFALRFDAFMRLALYDPAVGYYRRERLRVARERTADFYTATSLGPLFGELVSSAAAQLLTAAGLDPAAHTFIEIGAEPGGGVLRPDAPHPFAAIETRRVGEPLTFAGPCVVFSNELFDAQPVRRFIRRATAWHELGVALSAPGSAGFQPAPSSAPESLATLSEIDLGPAPADVHDFLPPLADTPPDYCFDAPLAAAILARELAAQPWHGLFVAFDYGKSFAELGHSFPAGTARAYHRHTQHNDLLARPGEQDLTAHVCWDWLAAALVTEGCTTPEVVSQESFFVHHAGEHIAARLATATSATDPAKRALMHLLHPGQMGQKFQVLHALKPTPSLGAPAFSRPGPR